MPYLHDSFSFLSTFRAVSIDVKQDNIPQGHAIGNSWMSRLQALCGIQYICCNRMVCYWRTQIVVLHRKLKKYRIKAIC